MLPFVLNRLSSFVKLHHFFEAGLMKELDPLMYTLEKPRSLTYSLLNKPEIPFNRLVTGKYFSEALFLASGKVCTYNAT